MSDVAKRIIALRKDRGLSLEVCVDLSATADEATVAEIEAMTNRELAELERLYARRARGHRGP